jgi:tetratricopeptide (TPR) repeat protein
VPVKLAAPVETFAIGFSDLASESAATFYLTWENVLVPVKIEVDVAGILVPQLEAVMAAPEGKKPYLSAAMFYYENNLDLDKALAWMDAGLAEQPTAFWMVYRKGLILAKKGDKAGAIAAAQKSLDLVKNAPAEVPAPLKDEYIRLNEALLATLK